jgi:hypothetical protein
LEILKDEFKILTGRTFSRNKKARILSVFSSWMSNYSFHDNFCQKIIIYLESLYNKPYFDIKFIWKYRKMNSKSWQDGLFHGTKWRENNQSLMSNYSFHDNFCQKIIIYLESLYNKLYFDIKFIWKYWKMNSKSWQDELFTEQNGKKIFSLWCQIILFIIISVKRQLYSWKACTISFILI